MSFTRVLYKGGVALNPLQPTSTEKDRPTNPCEERLKW